MQDRLHMDITMEELEQYPPDVQEAFLRIYRQKTPPPPPEEPFQPLKLVEQKTSEDLEREWDDHYKDRSYVDPLADLDER